MICPMHVDVRGLSVHTPVISLVDRRSSRPRTKEWLLTKSVELILFGPNDVRYAPRYPHFTLSELCLVSPLQRTTGSFYSILQKHSFDDAVMACEKKAVTDGILLEAEFVAIKDSFKPLIQDVEARNRVKRCSIVPTSVVVAACAAYGRCAQTVALMRALKQLPRVWQLQMEQEQNRARMEVDLLLDD